jgi:multidrug efflux system membrane fusion protein
VPDRAIDSDQGQKVLLTVNEKSQVVTRPVQVGALHDGLRAIADGLDPADRVIVNGLVNVRPGMVVQAEDQATAAAAAPVDASASARD